MQITTLGELAVDGRPVRGERLASVLRELVRARGRAVSTTGLATAVWDGDPPADEVGAVQALVSRLRRTGVPVVATAGGYRLPIDGVEVDVVRARELADRAAAALGGDAAAAHDLAREARQLFPAVPDLDETATARLFSDVVTVAARAALAGAGPLEDDDLRLLVARTPPDEPALALLVRVLAAQGRDAEALVLVEQVRAELADQYGADLSPVVAQAHLALLRGELGPAEDVLAAPARTAGPEPSQVAPSAVDAAASEPHGSPGTPPIWSRATSSGPRPFALPASWRRATTTFLGREQDLEAVVGLVGTAPLVTLVAPGGAGKTRLAAETARAAAAAGWAVHVVELAGLRTGDEVLPAVLAAVGGADTVATRADLTGDRRMLTPEDRLRLAAQDLDGLLVLDNCEHVLDAAATVVADLLEFASPEVTVLTTSRAPLGVVGESVHRLGALPDETALALLEARARAGRPDLAWDPHAALELCHRLDNLPLALELAAARLRSMTVRDVLDGLGDRFGLLDDALRGLPDRHARLWAMVDWSRELLPPAERTLLQRLAVIAGSFTAEAAVAVGGAEPADVRRGLAVLVEQSLLGLEEQDGGPARYRMLETVREYGEVRLDAAGDRAAAMDGLVRWATARACELVADFVGPGQVAAFDACARDQEALLVAARWAVEHHDEPAAVDVLSALFWLWSVRGLHAEVVAWSRRALRVDDPGARARSTLLNGVRAPGPLPDADRAALVATFAVLNSSVIESTRLAALGLRAAGVVKRDRPAELGSRVAAMVDVLHPLGSDDQEEMRRPAEELVGSDDPYVQGLGLFLRAALNENAGDADVSSGDLLEAFRCFERVGDHWGMGMAAQGIGQLATRRHDTGGEDWLQRSVQHLEAVGAMQDVRSIRVLLDVQRALHGDADALSRVVHVATSGQADAQDAAQAHLGLAHVAWSQGRAQDALRHADAGVAATESGAVPVPQARVFFRVAAATVHMRVVTDGGDDGPADDDGARAGETRAVALLAGARADAELMNDMPVLGSFAVGCAELAALRGDAAAARELYACGTRLGAGTAARFDDDGGPLPALVTPEALAPYTDGLRGSRVSVVAARVRALADALLG